jgi:hypothetical protein
MPRQTYYVVRGIRCHVSAPPPQCSRTSLAFFVRLSVVGLLRWLVGWLVGTAILRSLVCRWYSSFLPSFVGRKPFFPLVVGRRSSFVSSSLMDLRSFVRSFVRSSVGCRPSFVDSFVRSSVSCAVVELASFPKESCFVWTMAAAAVASAAIAAATLNSRALGSSLARSLALGLPSWV